MLTPHIWHSIEHMSEILDIVDENNQVIGQAERYHIHRDKLRHRAAHCIVFNSQGKVFLQLRHPKKDHFPNCWDSSVGGHVDSGETYQQCIARETEEELGVATNASLTAIVELPASEMNGWEFLQLYAMQHPGPFMLNPREISDGNWFSFDEVSEWLAARPEEFAGGFDLMWECFLAYYHRI